MPLPSPLRGVASAQAHTHVPVGLPIPSEAPSAAASHHHPAILPPISKMTDSPAAIHHRSSSSSSSTSSASKSSSPFAHPQQSQQPGSIMSAIPQPRDFHHAPPSAASSIRSDYYRDQQPAPAQYSSYRPPSSAYSSDQQPQPPQGYTNTQSGMNVQSWYGQASAPRTSMDTSSQAYPQYARESMEYQPDSRRASVTSVDSMQYTTTQRAPSPGSRNSNLDLRYSINSKASGGSRVAPRVAPPITNPTPYAPHPNAPSPTKGYPYAFPDPGASLPSSQSLQAPPPSSQYFPNGSSMLGYSHAANTSRTSIDSYDRVSARSLDLDDQAAAAQAAGVGPYSRSPELRQTHKIAERKRRRDMSLLYEDLKEILPDEKGVKSSKHEILVRAISVIKKINRNNDELRLEVNDLRAKLGMPPKKFTAVGVSSNGSSSHRGNRESTAGSELDDAEDDDHEVMDESK
ncbi:uncharacterized protein V1513DRAFT_442615 [Lipomyces chichibuensis]|uniref:uncharacterized protein n=1 Tax=Lipomyces chichibuensis TaxID=1546026 RepID=UPI00334332F5